MIKKADKEKAISQLFAAELQFRLACAVKIATDLKEQPLNVPTDWSYGKHNVKHNEIALRQDQAEYAAWHLRNSTTFLMATEIKNAIIAFTSKPLEHKDKNISNSFQIVRFIRNAFAHHPFKPVWSIEKKYQNKNFAVKEIIQLNTFNLNGNVFDWKDYGGFLAILKLCQFVRFEILKDKGKRPSEKELQVPEKKCIMLVGPHIFKEVNEIPEGAKKITLEEFEKKQDCE